MNEGEVHTLAIDIGGTGIKAVLLDPSGQMVGARRRIPTPPQPVVPEALIAALDQAIAGLGAFDRVSVGFPGYVRNGRIVTAPHLGTETLAGFDLQVALTQHWSKPVRVLNDADVQGYGAIRGQGIEMVLTLGTGAGTALFRDGELMPHLELAHHPIRGKKTYDEYIGKIARDRKGKKKWNRRVARIIETVRALVHFDHLYIGGGNAADLDLPLPPDVTIVPNTDGLTGGIRLWEAAAHLGEPLSHATPLRPEEPPRPATEA
jgi:polyphosphate glucokinase